MKNVDYINICDECHIYKKNHGLSLFIYTYCHND